MRDVRPAPDVVPLNRVHALDLAEQMRLECAKREWRSAIQHATARWLAEGNAIERVGLTLRERSTQPYVKKARSGYID